MALLEVSGLCAGYGQVQVLRDVDFTVDDGEMVALLGVNGAGKSTLLKVISGIGLPHRGSVRFRGTDITFLDAARTKAAARVTIGYAGGTVMLVKEGSGWRATELTGLWIT